MPLSERRSRNRVKLTRKDLKTPDEFLTLTGHLLSVASDHVRVISVAASAIVGSILIVWGLMYYFDRAQEEAFAALFPIEAHLRAVETSDATPLIFVDQLRQIAQRFGAGEARGYAHLYLGHVYYRKGDDPAALAAYQQALVQAKHERILWPLATLGVGYTLEAAGDLKGAQEAYQRVIDANSAGFVLEAYMGKGRAAEGRNDLESAIAIYSEVAAKFPLQAEARGIAEKVAALKARKS